MKIVVALGGNALLQRGEPPDSEIQAHHVEAAVRALAPLAREHTLVITHGNGPQIGLLALESAGDTSLSHPYPLDVLGAQTQGMVGYWLLQALQNDLPHGQVACVVTQTLVAADDPAWATPTKFIGPVYSKDEAERLADERGWQVRPDGPAWRRVVASPEPMAIVEESLVELLLSQGVIVVCAGGGGIPVVRDGGGRLRGVEAVVDKDRTSGLLAASVKADALLLLTDVAGVEDGYGTPRARPLGRSTIAELRHLDLPAGSMGPKVEAVCEFAERTGHFAAIGALADAEAILKGEAGTFLAPAGYLAVSEHEMTVSSTGTMK
jgi:carbamate kinase